MSAPEPATLTDEPASRPAEDTPWYRNSTIVAALIGAVAAVGGSAISAFVAYQAASPEPAASPEQEEMSLSLTVPARYESPAVLEGHVEGLREGMSVWTFNEPYEDDGVTASGTIYANPGPCPVDGNGDWSCGPTHLGAPTDVGKRFRIWATVVTDEQAIEVVRALVETYQGGSIIGSRTPPHVDGFEPRTKDTVLTAQR